MLTSVWKLLSQLWALLAVTGLGARGRAAAAASVLAVQAGEWVGCAVWGCLPLGNAAPDSQVPQCDSRCQGAGLFPTAGHHLLPRLVAVLLNQHTKCSVHAPELSVHSRSPCGGGSLTEGNAFAVSMLELCHVLPQKGPGCLPASQDEAWCR